jgi:hypothetical protein
MRLRIAAVISDAEIIGREFRALVEREIGIGAPIAKSIHTLLSEMDLDDVLDLVTVVHNSLKNRAAGASVARKWLWDVARIFEQENVQYRVEPSGGVRFAIDEAFAREHAASIAALDAPRYANSLAEFEKGMAALTRSPLTGKRAFAECSMRAKASFIS